MRLAGHDPGQDRADQLDLELVGVPAGREGAEQEVDASAQATYQKTPSSFDRSVEPPYGPAPEVNTPAIWENKLTNGLRVLGIQNTEVPLMQFDIVIDGGQVLA